jgi:uncharacterized protein YbjQ (UPF0145 family)
MEQGMLVVTTENVAGHRVVQVKGQCFGVVVRSRGLGATVMGANAVLMMRFDSSEIGQTMSEIVAYGTAAVIEPLPR